MERKLNKKKRFSSSLVASLAPSCSQWLNDFFRQKGGSTRSTRARISGSDRTPSTRVSVDLILEDDEGGN